jgi:dihydroneopterin aldolase/2-amino-4-hydroxy-6-hydroxymethyldihydropteridine diphosphokinase
MAADVMDKINIRNIEVFAKHGVAPEEKTLGQKFVISASLFLDLRGAGITDDLAKTLDYNVTCNVIKAFIEENTYNLIESAAERLAEKLLTDNPMVQKVWLEVKKPWAPVSVHLETVSVEIERGRHTAFIALGSNIGDRGAHLDFAKSELEKARGWRIRSASAYIETAPYGFEDQDDFLNGCLELETLLTPHELLELLHDIENNAGRERTMHWGPRTLDLDIIFFDDIVLSDGELRIPHAQMHKREFVLAPLKEIAPSKLHPVFMKTVSELLDDATGEDGAAGADGATGADEADGAAGAAGDSGSLRGILE